VYKARDSRLGRDVAIKISADKSAIGSSAKHARLQVQSTKRTRVGFGQLWFDGHSCRHRVVGAMASAGAGTAVNALRDLPTRQDDFRRTG